MCEHEPICPPAYAPDRDAAKVVAAHADQGWTLLCNGVVVFDDTGELLPDGRVIAPHPPRIRTCRPSRYSLVGRSGQTSRPAGVVAEQPAGH
jgi:hypothetical protein